MAVTLTKKFWINLVLFIVACVVLGLSIWAFTKPCNRDKFGDVGTWFCGNEGNAITKGNGKYGEWCTCPAGYVTTFVDGKWRCSTTNEWIEIFSDLETAGEVAAELLACGGLFATLASGGPVTAEELENAMLCGASEECGALLAGIVGGMCVAPAAAAYFTQKAKIAKEKSGDTTIPMENPRDNNSILCPWNHGAGGTGLSQCIGGCDSKNKSTNGCKNGQWCSTNMKLNKGESCECGAAKTPNVNNNIGNCSGIFGSDTNITCFNGNISGYSSGVSNGFNCK